MGSPREESNRLERKEKEGNSVCCTGKREQKMFKRGKEDVLVGNAKFPLKSKR